jgi:hypothetical protein
MEEKIKKYSYSYFIKRLSTAFQANLLKMRDFRLTITYITTPPLFSEIADLGGVADRPPFCLGEKITRYRIIIIKISKIGVNFGRNLTS